ncbi:uncharacterized protein [Rutidosis leptorrhynchoides]|uniref:uncharacterized protein n=1 Tax=Rutidosis leptorrhynchoides TaxID=125765 RepID=UPI003A9951BA
MTTSDDEEINPVTMLLLDNNNNDTDTAQQHNGNKFELLPTPIQHQTYHLNSVSSAVVIRQLPSQGLSFQLWPAADTFVKLLDSYHESNADRFSGAVTSVNPRSRPIRILELGSGTGVVGIAAAAILGADVTVTDLHHVLPNLKFNVDVNSGALEPRGGEVHVAALSWGENDEMKVIGREFDLIIGSDVVYHDNLFDPLLETLKYLLLDNGNCNGVDGISNGNGGEGEKVFLMGHLRRWKKESGFFKKAKKYFKVELVHEDGPSSVSRTGVVVYRFARKDAVFR